MLDFCAANAKHQELWPVWKVRLLALIAWALRIQFKIDGYPYGGPMSKRTRQLTSSFSGTLTGTSESTSLTMTGKAAKLGNQ